MWRWSLEWKELSHLLDRDHHHCIQPRRDAVYFRAQAKWEQGSCAWLPDALLWHRPCCWARQQAGCEVCRHYPVRHSWLRHLQKLLRNFPSRGKVRQHGTWGNTEWRLKRDPLWQQENPGHRRWKQTEGSLYTECKYMADHSVGTQDELHEGEASQSWMFCLYNGSPEKSCFIVDLVCFILIFFFSF